LGKGVGKIFSEVTSVSRVTSMETFSGDGVFRAADTHNARQNIVERPTHAIKTNIMLFFGSIGRASMKFQRVFEVLSQQLSHFETCLMSPIDAVTASKTRP
jgi:hypothetical protein